MAAKIDIYVPGGTVTFEEGVLSCEHINVHFYFANVVDIVIIFTDQSRQRFYQVACCYYTPAP